MWGAEGWAQPARWPFKVNSALDAALGGEEVGSWLACFWFLFSLLFLPDLHKSHPGSVPASLCVSVFIFQSHPRLPPSASSRSLLRMSLSGSPCLGLLFFLFRASSQTLLLLPNAAAAVSESLRLGTADRNSGQFLQCWNSAGWKVVSF